MISDEEEEDIEMDEKKEELIFELISAAGTAKSCYMEAVSLAKSGDFEGASEKMEEGEQIFIKGHQCHAEMLAEAANQTEEAANLILVHAEDQMMAAETIKLMAEEMIELYRRLTAGA